MHYELCIMNYALLKVVGDDEFEGFGFAVAGVDEYGTDCIAVACLDSTRHLAKCHHTAADLKKYNLHTYSSSIFCLFLPICKKLLNNRHFERKHFCFTTNHYI